MSSCPGQRSANSFSARNASSILPDLLHAVGVLEEVLLGVAVEALLRADLAELVVDDARPGELRRILLQSAMALLKNPPSAYRSTAFS